MNEKAIEHYTANELIEAGYNALEMLTKEANIALRVPASSRDYDIVLYELISRYEDLRKGIDDIAAQKAKDLMTRTAQAKGENIVDCCLHFQPKANMLKMLSIEAEKTIEFWHTK